MEKAVCIEMGINKFYLEIISEIALYISDNK